MHNKVPSILEGNENATYKTWEGSILGNLQRQANQFRKTVQVRTSLLLHTELSRRTGQENINSPALGATWNQAE